MAENLYICANLERGTIQFNDMTEEKETYSHGGKVETFEEFVSKFKAKKTTDDCYTPAAIYSAVLGWVKKTYDINDDVEIARPFYPNGDYQRDARGYGANVVVVDNPPFSIYAEILRFYLARGVKFFLFAPHLTFINNEAAHFCTCIVCNETITYANGATVNTSFVTNLGGEDRRGVWCCPELAFLIRDTNKELLQTKQVRKLDFPPNVINSARLGKIATHGVNLFIPAGAFVRISSVGNTNIFGGGLMLNDDAARAYSEACKAVNEAKAARAYREACKAAKPDAASDCIAYSEKDRVLLRMLNENKIPLEPLEVVARKWGTIGKAEQEQQLKLF